MKPFTAVAVAVFAVVAVLQLVRVAMGWNVAIDGFVVPAWVSVIVCAGAALLAVMIAREARA